jgi:DNA-binding NtrC family response regulator
MSRILVVDNDTVVSAGIRIILERNGMDVVVAPDGRTALEAVAADKFDIVIVDIFMAGMDGLETIRLFQKHAPAMPIIAVSGFMFRDAGTPAPDFLSMATKLGAAYSFAKPYRPRDLLCAVKRCLAQGNDEPVAITATTREPAALSDAIGAAGASPALASSVMAMSDPQIPPSETLPPASMPAASQGDALSTGEASI